MQKNQDSELIQQQASSNKDNAEEAAKRQADQQELMKNSILTQVWIFNAPPTKKSLFIDIRQVGNGPFEQLASSETWKGAVNRGHVDPDGEVTFRVAN